jgi:hypothetical protein
MNTKLIDEKIIAGRTTVWQAFKKPTITWDDIVSHIGTLWDEEMLKFHKIPMTFVAGYGDRVKPLADFMFEFNKSTTQPYMIHDVHMFIALGSRGQIHNPGVWDFNNLIWQVKGHSEIAFYDPEDDNGQANVLAPGDLIYLNPKNKFSLKQTSEGCYVSFALKKQDS